MKTIYSIAISFLILTSCNPASKKGDPETPEAKVNTTVIVPSALPSIPESLWQKIYIECDFVDYIFYELPFSMSYDKKGSIQAALRWVDLSTKIPTEGCEALGRMIFQSNGEIMIEAEIYVNQSCAYYKWIKDGKAVYNNLMTEKGINHYAGIIKQFQNR